MCYKRVLKYFFEKIFYQILNFAFFYLYVDKNLIIYAYKTCTIEKNKSISSIKYDFF